MKRIVFLMVTLFLMGSVVMAQGQRGEHKKMTQNVWLRNTL